VLVVQVAERPLLPCEEQSDGLAHAAAAPEADLRNSACVADNSCQHKERCGHVETAVREGQSTCVATTSSEPSLLKSIATGGVRISTLPMRTPVIKSYAPTQDEMPCDGILHSACNAFETTQPATGLLQLCKFWMSLSSYKCE
jgi:hypothetical protein